MTPCIPVTFILVLRMCERGRGGKNLREDIRTTKNGIYLCFLFQISGPLVDEGQVRSIVAEIKQVITASSSRKRERAERCTNYTSICENQQIHTFE